VEEEIENKLGQQRAMDREARLRAARLRVEEMDQRDAAASLEDESPERAKAVDDFQDVLVEAAIEWLEIKWGDERSCPYCGIQDWGVSVPFNLLLESRRTLAPHFSVSCGNCGNTVLINALLAGLFPEVDP
jgi:hypothetical protein